MTNCDFCEGTEALKCLNKDFVPASSFGLEVSATTAVVDAAQNRSYGSSAGKRTTQMASQENWPESLRAACQCDLIMTENERFLPVEQRTLDFYQDGNGYHQTGKAANSARG